MYVYLREHERIGKSDRQRNREKWLQVTLKVEKVLEEAVCALCQCDFDTTVHPTVPTGAMCTVWGQEHYRTFDNNVYTFIGSCEYQLVRDCALNTFSVNVINDRHCDGSAPCKRELDLYLGSSKVSLRQTANGLQVTWDGTPHSVPFSRSGTVFQQVGNYLTVQSPLGFLIKWDGKESIFFRVCRLLVWFLGEMLIDFQNTILSEYL